ncbi:hypothetical protein [Prosthecobacter vanneervenii]|uniref:LysM domain-containing protein n=1 Tax=Prosthecobacter vanneervenii TaxID=48466 RepID=A0A7W8DMX5_9BACT|nr:hypothetical protein [Prosthecobacter vanneervenii]MBB5035747.1 hypothetical protein [Prosthecobacter vanneervenii]
MKLFVALLLVLTGCSRKSTAKLIVPPLPKVEIADVPSPPTPSIIVEKGSNLRAIATAAYHHESFSSFVGQLNGISKPERLLAGAKLKTPSLPVALHDAGLDPQYQPAVNALSKSWTDLAAILPEYIHARYAARARDGDRFVVPEKIRKALLTCAEALDASAEALSHPQAGHVSPRSAIRQFAGASSSLQRFSQGFVESLDYDTYLVEQQFGIGFTNLLFWVQSHHK